MTEWHPVDQPPPQPAHRAAPARRRFSTQTLLLAVAGLLFLIALVIVLVVVLTGGSDGPGAGSPDAVVDDFATGLVHPDQLAGATCASARRTIARQARTLAATAAKRDGSAGTDGATGAARVTATSRGRSVPVTVALSQVAGAWCVVSIAVGTG